MADVPNPNLAQRNNTQFWTAPMGLSAVTESAVFISDLPTTDPAVVGQLYSDSQVVTVSAG